MNIQLNDDMIDEITVQNLLNVLNMNREMAAELLAKETNLESYEAQDLAFQLQTCSNLEKTLAYFLLPGEYARRVGKSMWNETIPE
jgi:hypothetical protein